MFANPDGTSDPRTMYSRLRLRSHRLGVAVASIAAAVVLSACGGGGYADSSGNFNIGVTVAGQFVSDTPVAPGGSLDLAVRAGQSVRLDAGEARVPDLRCLGGDR